MHLRTVGRLRGRATAALLCALLFAGCAGAPVQEMSDARQAINAAVSAGAEDKAPEKLEAARRLLTSAEEKLQQRAYGAARRDAAEARSLAIEALRQSDRSRQRGNESLH